jgi:hypothetical protein
MLHDWDTYLATQSESMRNILILERNLSLQYMVPRSVDEAIIIQPNEFSAILISAIFKNEEKYRMPKGEGPFPFEDYFHYCNSFKSRFKNPVKVWCSHVVLHVKDTINGRNGHFRLRNTPGQIGEFFMGA